MTLNQFYFILNYENFYLFFLKKKTCHNKYFFFKLLKNKIV